MFDSVSLEAITDEFAKAAGEDLAFASGVDLLDVVRGVERLRRLVDAVEAHALARIDVTNVCEVEFGMTAGAWLAHECRLPAGVARKRVRVAAKLATSLPCTDRALSAGEIGFDHAAAMAAAANPRIVEQIGEIEAELLAPIPLTTFERWPAELTGIAELLDEDGGHDPERDLARNRLHLGRDARGDLQGNLALNGEHSAGFEAMVNDTADELFRRFTRDHAACPELQVPSRPTLMALALLELCRHGAAVHHHCHPDEHGDGDEHSDDGHDDGGHSGCGCDQAALSASPAVDFTVVLNGDDPFGIGTTPFGARLTDEQLAHLRCDAMFSAIILNEFGVPLDLGREQRLANRAQRRALAVRDGGCVFPGCGAHPNWCDAHHVIRWESGGLTNLGNLALLCRRHHGITHRRGWSMVAHADQTFTWTTPPGRTLTSQRHRSGCSPPGGP